MWLKDLLLDAFDRFWASKQLFVQPLYKSPISSFVTYNSWSGNTVIVVTKYIVGWTGSVDLSISTEASLGNPSDTEL